MIHGLSGITYAGSDIYWSEQDNSDKVVQLQIKLNADASVSSVIVLKGLTLSDNHDNEGIALSPGGDSVFISEEDTPGIHEYSLKDGRRLRTLDTPEVYLHKHTVPNRGFESLSLSPDKKSLWTANEHALTVDGSPQTVAEPIGATTMVRLLRYAIDAKGNATPMQQFAYQTAGVHALAGFNSLTDMVALADGWLLTLERSAGESLGGAKSIKTRIFLVTTSGATDVSRPPFDQSLVKPGSTAAKPLRFVRKRLLYEGFVCEAHGENLEGLCLGPSLGNGRWAVLGVVDDTDGPMQLSRSHVIAFELDLAGTGKPH